jgi:uncharacterized RDD family membrane protein YckC
MLAVGLYMLLTQNRHDPVFQHGLKAFLFLVTGAYFIHAWSGSGHTLAMKTWRMRMVVDGNLPVPLRTATLRFLLAWAWFLPALIACAALGLKGKAEIAVALAAGMLAWGLTALFDKDRQFLHDRLAGTRLVSIVKPTAATPAVPAESH